MTGFTEDLPGDGDDVHCPQVSLSFGSEADLHMDAPGADLTDEELGELYAEMKYLDLTIGSSDCGGMFELDEFDDELGGFPAFGGGGHGSWEVAVGDAIVSTFSDGFEDAEIEAMISSLRPVTADAVAAAIPEWVADAMSSGEAFGPFPMAGMTGGMGYFG
jgi:hypothetical protein